MKKIKFVIFMIMSGICLSQSKKEIIDIMEFKIDSLKNVSISERNISLERIEILNTKIETKAKEIELLNEKLEVCEQKIKLLTEANVKLTIDYDRTHDEKTNLEERIKNLPFIWQYSPTMEKSETGEIEYKFILSKGGLEIISFLQLFSKDDDEPQIENLKIKWDIVDHEYEYLARIKENGEIEIAYNIFAYDQNDSKIKFNQWVKTLKQKDYQNWIVSECKGKCD